jgi:FkbM family methyltransferase
MARRALRHQLVSGERELALLPHICDKDHCFVDVGANCGTYSLYAKTFARSVLAFEPHPDVAKRLRRVLGNDVVYELALSDHSGMAELFVPALRGRDVDTRSSLERGANPGFRLRRVQVAVEKLDNIPTSNIGAMKVDVEGHELAVLDGATKTLRRDCPTIIIESEERHHAGAVRAVERKLSELGYSGHFIGSGRLRPISEFSHEEFQAMGRALQVGGARSADYINNFIFTHPSRREHLESMNAYLAA